jgi:hypothetical protein
MLYYINPIYKTLSETEWWGVAGEWRIPHTEELNNLYHFPNITNGEIKEEEMVESSSIHKEKTDVQTYKIMVLNARCCVQYRKKPWVPRFRIFKIRMKHSGI